MDRERRRREEPCSAAVDAALADADERRDQARAGGRRPGPLGRGDRGGPPRRVAPRRAETRAPSCATASQAFLADLVRERDAAEAAEKDRRIVERLAAIHNDLGVHDDEAKADAEYAAAFRDYGVDLDRLGAGGGRPGARRQPGGRGPGQRPRSMGVPAARAAPCATRTARSGWSPWPGRPTPTRGGIGSGSTLGRTEGGPARKLEALERLAATADVDRLPVASVTRLATSLASLGRRETAIALLRRAQASHRDDFWVNADLGRELMASGRPDEAVRFFAVAAGVRPRSGLALSGLGKALLLGGQPAEAADIFRELTRLRPEDALAHVALGSALLALGDAAGGRRRVRRGEAAEAGRLGGPRPDRPRPFRPGRPGGRGRGAAGIGPPIPRAGGRPQGA